MRKAYSITVFYLTSGLFFKQNIQ